MDFSIFLKRVIVRGGYIPIILLSLTIAWLLPGVELLIIPQIKVTRLFPTNAYA